MENYLYRISLCAESVWSPFYLKNVKPVYIVGESKEWAKEFAIKNIRDGLAVKSISVVARQLSPIIFSGEVTKKKSSK